MIEDFECLKTLSTNIAFWLELSSIASLSAMKTLTLFLPKVAFWRLDKVSFISYWDSTTVSLVIGTLKVLEVDPAGMVMVPEDKLWSKEEAVLEVLIE